MPDSPPPLVRGGDVVADPTRLRLDAAGGWVFAEAEPSVPPVKLALRRRDPAARVKTAVG